MGWDVVVRGGLVVDGTGAPGQLGDVAISGGKIAEIGPNLSGKADMEVDAGGLVVAPGFIDPHTHYDAQVTWDPELSCSSWHGITTVIMGNCGFGIAPCRARDREVIMRMLECVEGISIEGMKVGIRWDFETFPQYMDDLDRAGMWANAGAMIGHSVMRQFVMGDAAWSRAATEEEIGTMCQVVKEAMLAGAMGLSSSMSLNHVGGGGMAVPSRFAEEEETRRLVAAMGETGRGVLEIAGGGKAGRMAEIDYFVSLAQASGRPVTVTSLRHNPAAPTQHLEQLARWDEVQKDWPIYPQVTVSPLSRNFEISDAFVLFRFPVWGRVMRAPKHEWPALFSSQAFREDFRQALAGVPLFYGTPAGVPAHKLRRTSDGLLHLLKTHERFPGMTLQEVAGAVGKDVIDVFFDLILEDPLTEFTVDTMNTDPEAVGQLLAHPKMLLGLSDAGAHLTLCCEAGQTSRWMGHWIRERKLLSLEEGVRRITAAPADLFGLSDRGRLRAGLAADVVVFDANTITDHKPETLHDLPGGGRRLVQRASGIQWTFVNGAPVIRKGVFSPKGRAPGRMLRSVASPKR